MNTWYFLFSEQVFDVFGYGQQVVSSHKNKTDIEDRLHFFLEECDNLQVSSRFCCCCFYYNIIFKDEILRKSESPPV